MNDVQNLRVLGKLYGNVGDTNIIHVDPVNGDDNYGGPGLSPCATIAGAVAKVSSGQMIVLAPGTYAETVVLPDGVSMRGFNPQLTFISPAVTGNTDVLTFSTNNRVEDFTIRVATNVHAQLRGLVFPNTSAASCKARNVIVSIDNSTAASNGTSNIYAVHSFGTSAAAPEAQIVHGFTATVTSTGLGKKRAVLCDTGAHNFYVRDANFAAVNANNVAGGSYAAVETNGSNVVARFRFCNMRGATADVLGTTGRLEVDNCILYNSTAGGMPFYTSQLPQIVVFGAQGTLGNSLSAVSTFIRPGGQSSSSSSEVFFRVPRACVVRGFSVVARLAPGASKTDTFVLRQNATATALSLPLVGTATTATYQATTINLAAGDLISVSGAISIASAIADETIQIELV